MVIVQSRSKRKVSGGRYTSTLSKRKHMVGGRPSLTKVSEKDHKKEVRAKGGNSKTKLLEANSVNLLDPKTGKTMKATVQKVAENPANRHFVRRNILTKGTVIETDKGNARVTNRPGQEGYINAVLE